MNDFLSRPLTLSPPPVCMMIAVWPEQWCFVPRAGCAMIFRQGNKRKHEQQGAFLAWLAAIAGRVNVECRFLFRSRDDWAHFLFFRYHDQGNGTPLP